MRAEHAPEGRLVAPISWATLSVHVVASPGSHGAPEVGGLSVHSFVRVGGLAPSCFARCSEDSQEQMELLTSPCSQTSLPSGVMNTLRSSQK